MVKDKFVKKTNNPKDKFYSVAYLYMLIPDVDKYDPKDIYIGSTCNPIAREESHNDLINNNCCSRKLKEKYNCDLILIPVLETMNVYKRDLERLEQILLDTETCINQKRSYLSKEDKSILNIEYLSEYRKEDKICCHCGAKTKLHNIQRHRKSNCCSRDIITSPSQQLL
jgi:hypothetical protein